MMKTLLLFIAIFAAFLPESSGGLAPTWNICNCRWENWSSWTACSSLCGGGSRQRDREVRLHDIPGCDGFEKCATNDMGSDEQLCNDKCFNGGTFRHWSSLYGQCDCKKGYRGKCCDQIVTCGQPSSITNGGFTGSDFSYDHAIVYACDTDYNMTSPSKAILRCTEHGYWSNTAPECLYAVSCRSSPCQNGAICTNLLGDYQCTCLNGWTGRNCETDIQPPIFDDCPGDFKRFTQNMTFLVKWKEPIFHDPMGNEVKVTKNYPASTFEFPWGVFTVQYSAVKPSNGLTNECSFNVTIKPIPCKPLDAPENGYVVCNDWMADYASVCRFHCKKGHSFRPPFKQDDWYNCGASGHWIPSTVPSECVSSLVPDAKSSDDTDTEQLSDCTNNTETRIAKNRYIEHLLDSNFNSLCLDYKPQCDEMNVLVLC